MKQSRKFIALSRSLALLLGAAACAAEQPVREVEIDACALLEEQEIAAAMGRPVMAGERDDSGLVTDGEAAGVYSSTCIWRIMGDGAHGPASSPQNTDYVILLAMLWPPEKTPETFLQGFRDAAAQGIVSGAPVPLPIGDSAIWWGDGVAVAKGQTSVGVSVRLIGEWDERRTVAEELAEKIALRL